MEIEIGWEVEDLVHNSIVNIAFERMIFGKIRLEGYCDINHLIGKPKITKNEITENLKRLKEVHEWCKFYRECYCGARSYRDGGRTRIRTILLTQN